MFLVLFLKRTQPGQQLLASQGSCFWFFFTKTGYVLVIHLAYAPVLSAVDQVVLLILTVFVASMDLTRTLTVTIEAEDITSLID
jgi:hypothetical protein